MATRKDFDLSQAPYNLTFADGQKTLQQKWVVEGAQTVAYVKANIVPSLFARFNGLGWTDAQVMAMTLLPAYWNDAVLEGQGGGQPITGRITSNNGIKCPAGEYLVNYPCIVDGGEYLGAGTGFSGSVSTVSMNTTLKYDHAGWIGGLGGVHLDGTYVASGNVTTNIVFDSRNLMQSTTWQMLSGSNSYSESGSIDGFRFVGINPTWYINTYVQNGLALWDPGETYKVGRVFGEQCNGYGIACVRGTPAYFEESSLFINALGGLALIGTELNSINIDLLSGDDNPALIVMKSGYGRGSGGNITVSLGKSESGKRIPNKGQIVLWQQDPCYGLINIQAQSDMNDQFIDAPFVLKNNTSSGGQMVKIFARGWNLRTIVHDTTNQKRWAGEAYRPYDLVYSSRNGGTLADQATLTMLTSSAVSGSDRLGMVPNNGNFDYVTPSPTYDISGGIAPPPPPPTCVWVTGAWSAWSNCSANTQTRTRTVTSSVVGCTPPEAMPAVSETQSCSTPPPPPTTAIDPTQVVVLANLDSPGSAAMATAYATAWGVPSSNIVNVNLGSADSLGNAVSLSNARNSIAAKAKQYTVLAFSAPSRYGSQSITSAITFGPRTVSNLTNSVLYNYTGTTPFTDKGVRPSMMLISSGYIRTDAHGVDPVGTNYMILAKDQTGSPRGSARAGQTHPNLTVYDNRNLSNVGAGENACNNLSNDCWISSRRPVQPVTSYFGSMFKLCCDTSTTNGNVTWRKGYYGDHVTSFGGYLPALTTGYNSQGQTPITWHLDRGAGATSGTVSEPWQGGDGSLAQQFVNTTIFLPLYLTGKSHIISTWASIQCPDRTLIAGDALCAPYS
jgi:hypothetical protein